MKNNIWKCFLLTDLSNTIMKVFKDIFLGIYFLKITDGNIVNVGIYYITIYFGYVLFFYLINRCIKSDLIKLFRTGIFFNLIQCLCLLLAKEKVADHIIEFAILTSIANAFYCYPQQILIKRVNEKTNFRKYFTISNMLENLITIVFPIILGFLITRESYGIVFLLLSIITFISFILSFAIKIDAVNLDKIDIKKFLDKIKERGKQDSIKAMTIRSVLRSLSSFGVIQILIVLLTYMTVSSELSLGGIKSFITIISILVIYGINKLVKREKLNKLFMPTAIIQNIAILGLTLGMIFLDLNKNILNSFSLGFVMVLLYNLVNGICNPIFEVSNNILYYEFMCEQKIDQEDETNYIFYFEIIGHISRSIGYVILIISSLIGFTTNIIVGLIILFSLVYIGFAYVLKQIDRKYCIR